MSADGEVFEEREPIGYRLVVDVAGPGFRDTIKLFEPDRLSLEPSYFERNGVSYETYGEREDPRSDYVEVRQDYVISRTFGAIYRPDRGSDIDLLRDHEGQHLTPEQLERLDEIQREGDLS